MEKISISLSNKLANMSFVCSILIVCIHTTIECENTGSFLWFFKNYFTLGGIVSIAVPFFFIASGFFLAGHMDEKEWYKDAVIKRLKSLGIPYVFWNIFYFVFTLSLIVIGAKINIPFGDINEYKMNLVRIVEIFGLNPFVTPELPFLWYVRALIIFVVISPLIKCMAKWGVALFFVLYFLTDVVCDLSPALSKIVHWFISLRGLAYFSLGIYLRNNPIRKKLNGACALFILGSMAYLLGLWLSVESTGTAIASRALMWGGTPVMLLSVWMYMPEKRWLISLTRCSFAMFLMQSALITLTIGALRVCSLKEWGYTTISGYFLRLLLVVSVAIVLSNFLYTFSPRLSRLMFGGRG